MTDTVLAKELSRCLQHYESIVTNAPAGVGGAPTRPSTMPTEAKERKRVPIASGLLDYFPDAMVAVAQLSWKGNEQHNPGQPLHWARGKSTDHPDTLMRHFMERGGLDVDGIRHSAKTAWRALAILQLEIEEAQWAAYKAEQKVDNK